MVQNTGISTKFLTYKVYAESSELFVKNLFLAIFGSHLEILRKMQELMYHGKSGRWSNSDKIFDPQGIHRVICNSLLKIFSLHFVKTGFPTIFDGDFEFLHKIQKHVYFGNGAR